LGNKKKKKRLIIKEAMQIPLIRENEELIDKLKNLETKEEIIAAAWSMDNFVPLAYPKPHPWHTVVYERLLLDGYRELRNIFSYIGERVPRSAYKKLRTPSKTTFHKKWGRLDPNSQLLKWKKKLPREKANRILKVVHWFGLDFYNEDPEPDYKRLANWKPNF